MTSQVVYIVSAVTVVLHFCTDTDYRTERIKNLDIDACVSQ